MKVKMTQRHDKQHFVNRGRLKHTLQPTSSREIFLEKKMPPTTPVIKLETNSGGGK
jgi:hypothetical protein